MGLRRWKKVALGASAGVLLLAVLAAQAVVVGIDEYYSPGWYSPTADEAMRRHLLLARLPVTPARLTLDGATVVVHEAWVESQTHVRYRWFFFRRVLRDSSQRLIVRTSTPAERAAPASGRPQYLAYNDSLGFDRFSGSRYWIATVRPPYPDTVRLSVRDHW